MNGTSSHKRAGRVFGAVLIALVAAGGGIAGGMWYARGHTQPGAAGGGADIWYTCGMHPNVVQLGPGICPICQMNLTPKKTDDDADDDDGAIEERKVLYWRAPMDPNYVSPEPGTSPMGMDLVPVYAEPGDKITGHAVRIDPVTIQNMGIRTARVKRGPLSRVIRTLGEVDYDERTVGFVTTRFKGWIEKLHVDETGRFVQKGAPLFDIYSPEVYEAQAAYLAALRFRTVMADSTREWARQEADRNIEMAVTKLQLFDISQDQIDELQRTKQIRRTLTIRSPFDGIVTEKHVLEGMFINPGMKLYTIADLERVWVYASIYEYQLPWVRVGQKATIELPYFPGQTFTGKVVYIYPYLSKKTRDTKVRIELDNSAGKLFPNMVANVRLEAKLSDDALLLPREAYLDSGARKVAFVDRGGGKFEPREIQVGVEGEGGMVEVLYGLDEGEVVVTSGQFLLDSESKLKEAMAKMMERRRVAPLVRQGTGGAVPGDRVAIPLDAQYACPMENHPGDEDGTKQGAYFSAEPGTCAWCPMPLKPLAELDWVQVRRAAAGGEVAYTCPDHPHVFSSEPGTCPRDKRDLEPFKAMYTCRLPEHAGVIRTEGGACPECDQALVAFRGPWLGAAMAEGNVPATTQPAAAAAFRCPMHPFVHSDRAGHCTICAMALVPTRTVAEVPALVPQTQPQGAYVCEMHPKVQASHAGSCPICAMRLIPAHEAASPTSAPARIRRALSHATEHYLAIRRLFASDTETGLAENALGLAQATKTVLDHFADEADNDDAKVRQAVDMIHQAALKLTGKDLTRDRAVFADVSAGFIALLDAARPDRERWPTLTVYRCPMAKASWVQADNEMGNPYYGMKMLKCGDVTATK